MPTFVIQQQPQGYYKNVFIYSYEIIPDQQQYYLKETFVANKKNDLDLLQSRQITLNIDTVDKPTLQLTRSIMSIYPTRILLLLLLLLKYYQNITKQTEPQQQTSLYYSYDILYHSQVSTFDIKSFNQTISKIIGR